MKKIDNIWILVTGFILFFISYSFDKQISLIFKATNFALLNVILSFITNFGVVIAVMLAIPSIMLYKNNKKLMPLLWATSIASFLLALAVKLAVQRQRPIGILLYPFVDIIDYSFPSQHSIVVFSLLPMLTKYLPKQKYFWVVFAVLVAFSRIYFRLHFLSDVVFGAFAGYFIGYYLLNFYEKRNHGKNK